MVRLCTLCLGPDCLSELEGLGPIFTVDLRWHVSEFLAKILGKLAIYLPPFVAFLFQAHPSLLVNVRRRLVASTASLLGDLVGLLFRNFEKLYQPMPAIRRSKNCHQARRQHLAVRREEKKRGGWRDRLTKVSKNRRYQTLGFLPMITATGNPLVRRGRRNDMNEVRRPGQSLLMSFLLALFVK
jgi:hypothetical protein